MFAAVVGVTYPDALGREKVGYPTVKSEADFVRPIPYGETLDMSVAVERIGTRSIVFLYEGRRASDGEMAFRVRNVQVATDMDAWESTPIPDHHREAFQTLIAESAS
jgi:acyl-CoA thioesterase FadM